MNMMELDGLAADVDALFGISGLKEDLMDVAILGGGAGGAVIAGELLFAKVPWVKDQSDAVKAGIAVALGAGGGIALGRYVNKALGAGVAAGLIGWGVSRGVRMLAQKAGITALGQVSDRDLLLGMGAVDNDINVSDYRAIPGQTDGLTAQDFQSMPGQVDGLGQAGDVYTTDLRPMPGQNGGNGYISGIASSFS
jgi:hypothetical protein